MRRWLSSSDTDSGMIRRASPVLGVRIMGAVASFLLAITVARLLGAKDAGVFYLVTSIAMIGAAVGQLGLGDSLMRFIAAARVSGGWGVVRRTYRTGVLLALVSAGVTAAVLLALSGTFATGFGLSFETTAFRWGAFAVVPLVLVTISGRAFAGVERPVVAAVIQNLAPPTVVVIALLLLTVESSEAAVAIWAAAMGGIALVGLALWPRLTDDGGDEGEGVAPVALLKSSLPLLVVAAGTLAMAWTDTLMLGGLRTAEDVGVYNSARLAAALIGLILLALNSVVAPRFAALFEQGRLEDLARLARRAAQAGALLAAPACLVALAIPTLILGLFGSQFVDGDNALRILAIAQFVNVAAGAVGYVLIMTGNEIRLSYTLLAAVALNVALNLALIPSYGIEGAATATALSLVAFNLTAAWWARRILGAWTLPAFHTSDS